MKTFSVGHMSATDHSSTDFLSSISTAFLHFVEVPVFRENGHISVTPDFGSSLVLSITEIPFCFNILSHVNSSCRDNTYSSDLLGCFMFSIHASDCIVFQGNEYI